MATESARPPIPVANLYHLLSYAWEVNGWGDLEEVVRDDHRGYSEMLTRLIARGCVHLLKRGLHRDYREVTAAEPGIRGRLEVSATLSTLGFETARVVCTRDEFTADLPVNQTLKSTLLRAASMPGMPDEVARSARSAALRMTEVRVIPLHLGLFDARPLHLPRNNRFYPFLLAACRLLCEASSFREQADSTDLSDLRMYAILEARLPQLFEAFVRNFYRTHLPPLGWSRFLPQHIEWQWSSADPASAAYLPQMKTDITLEHPDRKIILDTKFYRSGGINDRGTFESHNLYQLHAYVSQLARRPFRASSSHPHDIDAEGILLYATASDRDYLHRFSMPPHRMTVATVNLAGSWRDIESRLLEVLA